MRIAARLAQRDRVNEADAASHQFGEGGLGAGLGVATEQLGVFDHGGTIYL